MATETVEIVLGEQNPCRLQIPLGDLSIIKIDIRDLNFRKTVKEAHQEIGLLIREAEGRHPHLEPGTYRNWPLQKSKQPIGLDLFALTVENGRGQGRALIISADKTPPLPNLVTANTVVLVYQSPTLDDLDHLLAVIRRVTRQHLSIIETGKENAQGLYIIVR